ncbi:hypothetical protein ACFLSV_08225, partial [Bacteroidota bacterium]
WNKFIIRMLALVLFFCISIYGYNFFSLQYKMNKILIFDHKNKGIDVSVGYKNYINLPVIVFDLRKCSYRTKADVLRVLFQFAEKKKESNYDYVILSCQGIKKFKITGKFFKKLGKEFREENLLTLIKTFPDNVLNLDNSPVFPVQNVVDPDSNETTIKECYDFMCRWFKNDKYPLRVYNE